MTNNFRVLLSAFSTLFIATLAFGATSDSIHVLKISPQDQRAVIKQTNGTMRIVKVGDAVGDYGAITEIAPERVVLEKVSGNESERIIIHLEKGEQRVERLKRTADKQPPLYSPNAQKRK